MALSPNYWVGWTYTCTKVLLTELSPYNITGNKDTQLQHSPQGPGTFPWICGEDASLHRPQTKLSVCSAHQPSPPKHHIFLLLVDGEK